MSRGDTAARLIRVIAILEAHPRGLSIRELHERIKNDGFDCSPRTIYRDLDVIQKAYFPIVNEGSGDESKWKLNSLAKLNEKIQFSYQELMALFLAKESLQALRGTALFNHINNFITRIEKALGTGAEKELKNLSHVVAFRASAGWQTGVAQEILDTAYDGCYEGYVLKVEYKAKSGQFKDQVHERRLGPEGLYFADAAAYLIAKDLNDQKYKTYSLSRIVSVIRTEDPYESNGFSLKDYLKDGIGVLNQGEIEEVQLLIADPIGSYVAERRWHDSQQTTRGTNGIRLKLNVRLNDELVRWILGLGPDAFVESPHSLRVRVQNMALAIAKANDLKNAS